MFAEAVHLTNISLVECSKLQKAPLLSRMSIISWFLKNKTVFELFLNLPFHASLQCFCFAPYGTSNPRSQTGSMRVRGQTFLLYGFFLLIYSPPAYIPAITPCPAFTPPCWKTPNHPHQLQSILPFITYSSNIRCLLSPPAHLSCCPIWCCLSNCQYPCPMRLYRLAPVTPVCSSRCSIHDVGTLSGHPVCLLSVWHSSPLFDACVLYVALIWQLQSVTNAPIII